MLTPDCGTFAAVLAYKMHTYSESILSQVHMQKEDISLLGREIREHTCRYATVDIQSWLQTGE